MTDYTAVLTALHPGAQWKLDGDDFAGLTWLDDTAKPTKKSLDDAWPDVKAARDLKAAEDAARPSVEDRLATLEARLDRVAATTVTGDAAKIRDAVRPAT